MSSFPMAVACLRAAGEARASGLGLRQYKYCLVSCGLMVLIRPNTNELESGEILFMDTTAWIQYLYQQPTKHQHHHKLIGQWGSYPSALLWKMFSHKSLKSSTNEKTWDQRKQVSTLLKSFVLWNHIQLGKFAECKLANLSSITFLANCYIHIHSKYVVYIQWVFLLMLEKVEVQYS